MKITKSTRHQKIIGQYGEMLVCNWLSRSGFEVTLVDHTGIDVLAYDPKTQQRLGITVKSRTRTVGREKESVNIFSYRGGKNDRQKTMDACLAFACKPWLAVYVERASFADLYLTSVKNYDDLYGKTGRKVDDWKMGPKQKRAYEEDPNVKHVRLDFGATNWWRGDR